LGRSGWMRKAGLFSEIFWLREHVLAASSRATSEGPLKEWPNQQDTTSR
jgi:hypothetical protein